MHASPLEPYYDIVILGAGPAGIAAARAFLGQGYRNILIVEARDRIGGKAFTDPVFGDLGPTWSHINDARLLPGNEKASKLIDIEKNLIREARERGFTLSYDGQQSHVYRNGERIEREKLFTYAERATEELEHIVKEHGDISVENAFKLMHQKDAFMEWVLNMEFGAASSGHDIAHVSTDASLKTLSLASGVVYKEGLGNLIQEMGKEALPHTTLNTRLSGLHTDRTPFVTVDVINANGLPQSIRAKTVLSTIPPAVLNHKGDDYEIAHNLPEWKTKAMEQLTPGVMNKIILKLPDGYMKKHHIDDNRHYEIFQQDLGHMFFLAAPAGKDMLMGLVGGEQSIAFEKDKDAAVRHALDFLETVPELKNIRSDVRATHVTNWYQDPYARGGYGLPMVGAADVRAQLSKPVDQKIFFAGEACAQGGWETQVYGAMETGTQAAQDMMHILEASKRALLVKAHSKERVRS